jgi:uncharacterized membrane protein YheB (UPF0754 family)
MDTAEWIKLGTIPVFTGVIGYIINWTGVWMLFHPVRFHGFKMPGLAPIARLLPRKLQEVPGVMHGGVGWQGVIPSRAAKMGSISVDKGIAKVGTAGDFYRELEPQKIAEQILVTVQRDIRGVVERIMRRDHEQLWNDLPPRVREAIHQRVQQQLPAIVRDITDEIGENIDQLMDPKLMVVRQFERQPELANRIFTDVGQRELRLMINFGFLFGFLLGVPVAVVSHFVPEWWLLPVLGVIVGWITNLLGMKVIFEPVEQRKLGPFKLQGLFLRRQDEVAEVYAKLVAEHVVTLENVGDHLFNGPRSDRTRQMLEEALLPAVDRATGPARPAVRVAMGTRDYDSIRDSVAAEAVEYTMTPFQDPDFSQRQSESVRVMISKRMHAMSPKDFVEMLRSAIKEDEWMLYAHGAVLGFGAGLVHLGIFGV